MVVLLERSARWSISLLAFQLVMACGTSGESDTASASDNDSSDVAASDEDGAETTADSDSNATGTDSPQGVASAEQSMSAETRASDTESTEESLSEESTEESMSQERSQESSEDDTSDEQQSRDEAEGSDTADGADSAVSNAGDQRDDEPAGEPAVCSDIPASTLRSGCWSDADCGGVQCIPREQYECMGTAPPVPEAPPPCWQPEGSCPGTTTCVEDLGCVCGTDADCSEGLICDPDSPGSGCRIPDCREGEVSCDEPAEHCDPNTGRCAHRPCSDSEALPCPAGEACNEVTGYCAEPGYVCTWNGCDRLHCAEQGAFPCDDGQVCDPDQQVGYGCRAIPCNEPGATPCAEGYACNELGACEVVPCDAPTAADCETHFACDPGHVSALPNGCRPLNCSEPAAEPCEAPLVCAANVVGRGCFECVTDADCACGVCLNNVCRDEIPPGVCNLGCP